MNVVYILVSVISSILMANDSADIVVTYVEQKRYSVDEYIDRYVKTDNPALLDKIRDTYDKVRTEYVLVQKAERSSYYAPDIVDTKGGNTKIIRSKNGEKHRYTSLAAKNIFTKDYGKGDFKAMIHSRSGDYNIVDKIPQLSWELKGDESKMILGYQCQRAIISDYKGFDVEAWYTTEIPISNGPMEYGDLPGLILELSFASFKYLASDICFNSLDPKYEIKEMKSDGDNDPFLWSEYIELYYK